jgi:hypothetical protein
VLRASRGKGAPQKIPPEGNYFISQILGSKTHQNQKMEVHLIDVPEKATSSFTEATLLSV